jgi:hypothetical protein
MRTASTSKIPQHHDCKKHALGCFDTKQQAALAYDKEARQCGEDKLLNYESTSPIPRIAFELF